ncbi:MAG: hypothetical protein NTV51_03445, partial [Verrucomicrobia bacterium]|nr:hypothetical protein [Verrucomicrobiota bacterium]
AGGGNSMLDAGLASVAGAGQIQEAQKGLERLRNYVTERGIDTEERYQGGQEARAREEQKLANERSRNAGWRDPQVERDNARRLVDERRREARAWEKGESWAKNPYLPDGSNRKEVEELFRSTAHLKPPPAPNKWDAPGVGRTPMPSYLPSWAKPKGF